jgi:hypothetical protein
MGQLGSPTRRGVSDRRRLEAAQLAKTEVRAVTDTDLGREFDPEQHAGPNQTVPGVSVKSSGLGLTSPLGWQPA